MSRQQWSVVVLGIVMVGFLWFAGDKTWQPYAGVGVLILLGLIWPPFGLGMLGVIGLYLLLTRGQPLLAQFTSWMNQGSTVLRKGGKP